MLNTKMVRFPQGIFEGNIFSTLYVCSYPNEASSRLRCEKDFYRTFQTSRKRILELLANAYNKQWSSSLLASLYKTEQDKNIITECEDFVGRVDLTLLRNMFQKVKRVPLPTEKKIDFDINMFLPDYNKSRRFSGEKQVCFFLMKVHAIFC